MFFCDYLLIFFTIYINILIILNRVGHIDFIKLRTYKITVLDQCELIARVITEITIQSFPIAFALFICYNHICHRKVNEIIAGGVPQGPTGGKSELRRAGCRLMAGGGDPKASATEM
jgi:hypothetical protein